MPSNVAAERNGDRELRVEEIRCQKQLAVRIYLLVCLERNRTATKILQNMESNLEELKYLLVL